MFGFQRVYRIRDAIDGPSNTVAYSERVINPSTVAAGIRYSGVNHVGTSDAARVLNVATAASAVRAALAQCDQAWQSGGGLDNQKGRDWTHGCMTQTLFNTTVPPNSKGWTHCINTEATTMAPFSNASSYHPGGVNTLMGDGSVRFIKDSIATVT